jgi:hypothetical protein
METMNSAHTEDSETPLEAVGSAVARHPVRAGTALLLILILSAVGYLRFVRAPRIEAPRPASVTDVVRVPDIPPSSLNVPVSYDLTPIIRQLEDIVPRAYGSLDQRVALESNERASVAFELSRTPFRVSLVGDVVRLSSVISYKARGWYDSALLPEVSASCGTGDDETPPRLVVSLSARLSLSEDWLLHADGRVDGVSPRSEDDQDKCRITPLNINVTDRVVGAARGLLDRHMPEIERAIAQIDLGSKFREWWDILREPIELEEDVWLMIDPTAVRRGTTGGSGRTLVANVGLTAHPHLSVGPRPEPEARPLPRLDTVHVAEGLHIRATASAEYRTGSDMLTRELGGQILEQDGRTLEIVELHVSGLGDGRVVVELDFKGSAQGRVFLVGTPHYDVDAGEVYVPDLDFDLASLDLLIGGLDWFAHDQAVAFLRAKARWPVDDLTGFAEIQLLRGLNRQLSDEAQLRGTVDSVRVIDVYATRQSLVVHAEAFARAELLVGTTPPSEEDGGS